MTNVPANDTDQCRSNEWKVLTEIDHVNSHILEAREKMTALTLDGLNDQSSKEIHDLLPAITLNTLISSRASWAWRDPDSRGVMFFVVFALSVECSLDPISIVVLSDDSQVDIIDDSAELGRDVGEVLKSLELSEDERVVCDEQTSTLNLESSASSKEIQIERCLLKFLSCQVLRSKLPERVNDGVRVGDNDGEDSQGDLVGKMRKWLVVKYRS